MIEKVPVNCIPEMLKMAYERELYERWLTIYPYMELGYIEFINFEDYKNKALENNASTNSSKLLSDEEIINEMMGVERAYKSQKKEG